MKISLLHYQRYDNKNGPSVVELTIKIKKFLRKSYTETVYRIYDGSTEFFDKTGAIKYDWDSIERMLLQRIIIKYNANLDAKKRKDYINQRVKDELLKVGFIEKQGD